jgi:formylglycine-generating enzyme required for sulfatase activity
LFNDIVLVEQGGTVTIPQKGSARARAAQQKAKKKKRGVLVGAVLLLAVAGGGYAWSVYGGGGAGPADGKVAASAPDSEQLVEKLASLKERLANNGPDPRLRTEVFAVPEEPSTKASRNELLEDVDRGLAVRQKLGKVKPPDSLTVPFDDLKAYFASVDKALEVDGQAGRDLQLWLNKARVNTRAENALGPIAVNSLTVAFREWQADRTKAGNDEAELLVLALEKRLQGIEDGRRTLLVQIPSQEKPLERALPVATLDKARQSLTETSVPAASDVDVSEVLTEIQQKFEASGPDAALVERTRKLVPTREDQIKAKDQLLIALERAGGVVTLLETTRTQPPNPELPFDTVESYYAKIELTLEPLRTGTAKALPPWAETRRTALRDEKNMQQSVMRVCRNAYTRWNRQRDDVSGTGSEDLVGNLQQLKQGIATAGRLFPDSKAEFDKIIPETALAEVKAESERVKTRQVWLGSSKKLLTVLDNVKQLADWRAVAKQTDADLEALRTGAADLAKDPAVMGDLQRASKLRDAWTEADKRVTELSAKIAAGDLKGADNVARAGMPGLEGKEEFRQLGDAAARCRDAFDGLDNKLEIDQASALLAEARELLKNYANLAPAADARIKEWIAKVDDLKRTAAGMVQIEAGTTRLSAQQVQAFFLAPTECSSGDFNKFLKELHAAVDNIKDPAAKLQAVAPRFVGADLNQERLQSLLDREQRRVSDKLPADKIDWHAAAAYCAWNGLALPTPAEWSLAAFGPGNRFAYPWGPEWSNDPQQRNTNNQKLAEVDAGGLSWRKADGKSMLHHLGGNVAEWLAAEPGATTAPQAGGRYNDSDSKAREAAGGVMSSFEKTDTRLGVGFRTALRPRTFIGQLWPR